MTRRMALPLGGFEEVEGSYPHPKEGTNPEAEKEVYDYPLGSIKVSSVERRYVRQGRPRREGREILDFAKGYLKSKGSSDIKVVIGKPDSSYADASWEYNDKSGEVRIKFHPIIRFCTNEYIRELIDHELGHIEE